MYIHQIPNFPVSLALLVAGSNPVVVALNVAYISCKLYNGTLVEDDYTDTNVLNGSGGSASRWRTLDDDEDEGTIMRWLTSIGFLFQVLGYVLALISVANTVYLFNKSKKYELLQHPVAAKYPGDTSWMIKSPNAKIIIMEVHAKNGKADAAVSDEDDEDFTDIYDDSGDRNGSLGQQKKKGPSAFIKAFTAVLIGIRWVLVATRNVGSGLLRLMGYSQTTVPVLNDGAETRSFERKWQLNIWEPPLWSLKVFCWFSPPQVAIMYFADGRNWPYYLPVALLTGLTIHIVVTAFMDLLNDRQILHRSLLEEYQNNFVYQQAPFRLTHTAAVGTESDLDVFQPHKVVSKSTAVSTSTSYDAGPNLEEEGTYDAESHTHPITPSAPTPSTASTSSGVYPRHKHSATKASSTATSVNPSPLLPSQARTTPAVKSTAGIGMQKERSFSPAEKLSPEKTDDNPFQKKKKSRYIR
ncbi:hypothetical protein HK102_007643 [Quaeritorhiza haematococci]|nr:hypothetical protein HK102_007643 [Quaeritorhiza haematococci]